MGTKACEPAEGSGHWSEEAAGQLTYSNGEIIELGFADRLLKNPELELGRQAGYTPTATSRALVFFGRAINLQGGRPAAPETDWTGGNDLEIPLRSAEQEQGALSRSNRTQGPWRSLARGRLQWQARNSSIWQGRDWAARRSCNSNSLDGPCRLGCETANSGHAIDAVQRLSGTDRIRR